MRMKLGIPSVACATMTFTALAMAALSAGCDTGGGSGTADQKQSVQASQENTKKILEETNAAISKKGGAKVNIGGKPGAVGGAH